MTSAPTEAGARSADDREPATKNGRITRPFHLALRRRDQRMFEATKSQLTRFQNASTYFGRALR